MQRYTPEQLDELAQTFERDGLVVLKQLLPTDVLVAWRRAFASLLDARIADQATAVRGAQRHYITLPFSGTFTDERIFCNPDILGIVERVVGKDPVMCQLATDTPLIGSTYQDVHRDTPALFDDFPETPSFQLAVNFPLCDVTPENGPFETTVGNHRMRGDDAMEALRSGKAPLREITMAFGDVMIRDVRALHRGTPNKTAEPRPMVVIGYSRSWFFRPEVKIDVPQAVFDALSDRAKRLLRYMPRVSDSGSLPQGENYINFAYTE